MTAIRILSLLLSALLASACALFDSESPGSFSVAFDWEDPQPEQKVWISGSIVQRSGDEEVRLMDTRLKEYDGKTTLPFRQVGYGREYVVVVQVWPEPSHDKDEQPLYYGESKPFDLVPGKHVDVKVELHLRFTPNSAPDGEALTIQEAVSETVSSNVVTLVIAAKNATDIVVANDLLLERGKKLQKVENLKQRNGKIIWEGWDLDAGCSGMQCEDGTRTVYMQLSNAAGYKSDLARATVTLDRAAPTAVASLVREPFYGSAQGEGHRVLFSRVDPLDPGQPVTARLVLTASEDVALTPAPTVVARSAAGDLVFTLVPRSDGQGRVVEFVHAMESTDAAGDYTLEVEWSDTFGNRSPRRTLDVVLTLTDQVATGTIDLEKTLYRRAPWGEEATNGTPRLSLTGRVDLPTDIVELLAYRDGFALPAKQMGRATLGEDGSFAIETLSGGDSPTLYLVPVTAAGVRGEAQLVTRGTWVASLGGKTPGDTLTNPHVFSSWSEFPGLLRPHNRVGRSEEVGDGLITLGSGGASVRGNAGWTKLTPVSGLGENRYNRGAVFDSARGVLVVFGGLLKKNEIAQVVSDTHEWDGDRWQLKAPAHSPPATSTPAVAFDSRRGKTVMVGSEATWEWDGTDWTRVSSTHKPPMVAKQGAIAFDQARGVTVLVNSAGTWTWDGSDWSMRNASNSPQPGAMAYDAARHEVVLAGDEQTWRWSGSLWTAGDRSSDERPIGAAQAVYDPTRERVLTLTHVNGDAGHQAQLWAWDGRAWELMSSDPQVRDLFGVSLAFDTRRNVLMRFGGQFASTAYQWDGGFSEDRRIIEFYTTTASWVSPEPSARSHHFAAHDAETDSLVLYDGRRSSMSSNLFLGDVWSWNGYQWKSHSGAVASFNRGSGVMISGASRASWLQASGSETQVSSWTGQYFSLGATIPLQYTPLVAADPFGGIVFVGSSGGTWQYLVNSFRSDGWAPPGARTNQSAAMDPVRNVLVVVDTAAGTTWEWRPGGEWKTFVTPEIVTSGVPVSIQGVAAPIQYDTRRRKMLLFDSRGPVTASVSKTLEWDGERWSELQLVDAPSPRWRHTLTEDPMHHRVLLFGGSDGGLENAELWSWHMWDVTPGQTLQVDVSAASLPKGTEHTALHARWAAGARSRDPESDGEVDGACLLVWSATHYSTVECNQASEDEPEVLELAFEDSSDIQELFYQDTLQLAVKPEGKNGSGLSALSSDHVEVELSYRLPDGI